MKISLLEQIKQGLIGTEVNSENYRITDEDWFLLDGEEWYIGEDIGTIEKIGLDNQSNLIVLPLTDEEGNQIYYGFVWIEEGWLWYDTQIGVVNKLEQFD